MYKIFRPHRLVGLGRWPLTPVTGVRIPLGTPPYSENRPQAGTQFGIHVSLDTARIRKFKFFKIP